MKSASLISVVLALTSASCATVFSGTSQMVSVASEPAGAKIYMDGEYKGETPASFRVKRKLDGRGISLRKEGFPDLNATLESHFNAVSILNIFIPIGFVVDVATGALMKYDNSVSYKLEDPSAKPLAVPPAKSSAPISTADAKISNQKSI